MKNICFSAIVLLLLTSCSRQVLITKTPKRKVTEQAFEMQRDSIAQLAFAAKAKSEKYTTSQRNYYAEAFVKLQAMLNAQQPASFKDAVFITENAWYNNSLSYNSYNQYIKALITECKAYKQANHLHNYHESDSLQIALSGAIYKVLTDTIKDVKGNIINVPCQYNFKDAFAENDWADRFVTSLMATHTGNCHSLPFLYKIIAEELNVPAYLSFLPEHIYIRQPSKQVHWYNTELTSKTFPVDAWLMTSGYVSTDNIVSGIYMDTLGLPQSIAVCVNDLAKGYEREFQNTKGVNTVEDLQFIIQCCNLGLKYYPNYAELLLLKAETLKKLYLKGNGQYAEMEKCYMQLAAFDYREMPDGMYYRWMSSLVKGDTIWNRKADSLIRPYNPFASIGQKPKGYLTLSNGYYDENFINDTLRRIGTVVFNTVTNKIERFIENNETEYSAQLERPKDDSRFMSIDPLAKNYPALSPYSAFANNPILYIDPDGRKILIYYIDENGINRAYEYGSKLEIPNNEFVQKTIDAINHLSEDDIAGSIIGKLASSQDKTVSIGYTSEGPIKYAFDANLEYSTSIGSVKLSDVVINSGSIFFDPNMSISFEGGTESPSTLLGHELGHAFDAFFTTQAFIIRSNTYDAQYNDQEERFVEETFEQHIAKFFGEGLRMNHGYKTITNNISPNSTQQSTTTNNNGTPVDLTGSGFDYSFGTSGNAPAAGASGNLNEGSTGSGESSSDRSSNEDVFPLCFIKGTKVIMSDGSLKNIEDVHVDDSVKTVNIKNMKISNARVYKTFSPIHDKLVRIDFEGGIENINTEDHPYFVKGKGWCSFKPDLTNKKYSINALSLEKGDIVYCFIDNNIKEIKIDSIVANGKSIGIQTFNVYVDGGNSDYLANGILVHDEILTSQNLKAPEPDEIDAYTLNSFTEYVVNVDCGQVKYRDPKVSIITDKTEIKEICSILGNESSFIADTTIKEEDARTKIDARTQIDYVVKGKVIETICWSRVGRIVKDGKVYLYNNQVEQCLRKYGLIP